MHGSDVYVHTSAALIGMVLCSCPVMQVDRWLQPYLEVTLKKLQSAENRLLKDELLLMVANALYYNAAATVSILQQFGAVQQLFALMFSCIFARK